MNGNPYRLFINPRSPFARRIRLAMRRLGLPLEEEVMNAFDEPAELNAANPLGLLPTLFTPDLGPISDSANILEYLHDLSGQIWPKDLGERTRIRQASVLAAGIMQSSVLYFQETGMHDIPSARWAQEHLNVIHSTLDFISQSSRDLWFGNNELTQAGWDLAGALEYVSLRIPEIQWKKKYPILVELHARACENAFFMESAPKL